VPGIEMIVTRRAINMMANIIFKILKFINIIQLFENFEICRFLIINLTEDAFGA
jgi:hypothetical protein